LMPARLDAEQAAWYLGFQPHDIPVLIAADLLRPLGRPQHNAVKYFAAVELESLRSDSKWLGKATDAVQSRWRRKNRTQPVPHGLPLRSGGNGRVSAGAASSVAVLT